MNGLADYYAKLKAKKEKSESTSTVKTSSAPASSPSNISIAVLSTLKSQVAFLTDANSKLTSRVTSVESRCSALENWRDAFVKELQSAMSEAEQTPVASEPTSDSD